MKGFIIFLVLLSTDISYADSSYKDKIASVFSDKFITVTYGKDTYCFKGKNSTLKPIRNIGKCQTIDNAYLTNKGSVCIETDDISCKDVKISNDGKYIWGEDKNPISIYSDIDGLISSGNFLKKEKILKIFADKYIAIQDGNSTLCFRQKNNEIKVINNIGSCKKIGKVYISNESSKLCVNSDFVECQNVYATNSGYSWGNKGKVIRVYNKLSNIDNFRVKKTTSIVKNKHIATNSDESITEMSGKKLYGKAKKFFEEEKYYKAYEYAKKSADKGYKGGFYGLGLAYDKGYGVIDIDKKKAIEYYQKASDLGHIRAKKRLKKLLGKTSSSSNNIKDTKYSCVGDVWEFGATGGSSNSSESYWKYPEVKDGVLTVPEFGTYTFRGKKDKALYWKRTEGKDRKKNWAKIDLGGGESLITKKDTYAVLQFKGKCSVKN